MVRKINRFSNENFRKNGRGYLLQTDFRKSAYSPAWTNKIVIININGESAMKSLLNRKWMLFMCLCMWVLVVRTLSGCSMSKDDGNKVRDLEFSVTAEADIPQELKQIIAEKQKTPFKLTYSDDQNLYIVVGYGKQDTGGYSITVNELYLTENSIVLDTDLLGPEKGESGGTEPSFPFIVIKTELSELPVVFQ